MGCESSSQSIAVQPYKKETSKEQQELNSTMTSNPINNKLSVEPAAVTTMKHDRKHIMLSYQHNDQALVLYVYEFLQKHKIRTWMDIKGGMKEHILDSEAAAVENSVVVVCFLSLKYQESNNCKDEFKYARKKDKPIIPCLIYSDWKPTGWLDMGIGDSLYVNFSKAKDFDYDSKCEELLQRIKLVAKTDNYIIGEDEDIPTILEEGEFDADANEKPNYDDMNLNDMLNSPSSIREGSEIKTENFDKTKFTKHVCEGDSSIRLLLTGKIEDQINANQEHFSCAGKFINYFFIPKILFQNTSQDPLSVIEITGQYEDINGTWHDCENVKIGLAVSDDNTPFKWLPNTTVNIEPLKIITYSLRVDVQVYGEPGYNNEHRNRAHKTLPQPFKIRVCLHDTQNKTASLILEQLNQPLNIPTKEKLIEMWNYKDILAFLYADDCNKDQRYWALVHLEDNLQLHFSFGNDVSFVETKYLEPWLITKLYNQAKKALVNEILITDWNNEWRKTIAIFDKNTFNLYAIRIELTTATSKTIQTILLPLDKIKERFDREN